MKINKRDLAQLSAYLDGELSQREVVKLEKRIKSDPDLQAALEGLEDVKTVLSATPRLAVPRNFKLKPDQVGLVRRRAPVRAYGLAAAALSFLFVTVLVLDLGAGVLKGGLASAPALMAEEVMLEAAADAMEEPAAMEVEGASEEMMEEAMEEAAPAAEMETAPPTPDTYGETAEGEALDMEGADNKTVEEESERSIGEEEEFFAGETQTVFTEEDGLMTEEPQTPLEGDSDWSFEPARIPWMRILQVIFGVGAVGFGIAAWRKRQ